MIRELLGERVREVLDGKRRRVDSAPLLLRLLEQKGDGSRAMLELFSGGITHFDELNPPGWREWRATLPGLDRTGLLSRHFELLTAMWFEASGHDVGEFEPDGALGHRADLLVAYEGDEMLVEATSPGPHRRDWIGDAMDHLVFALSRVESGLEAAWERQMLSARSRETLARAQGVKLGTPRRTPAATVAKISKLKAQGSTLQAIADQLNRLRVPTTRGGSKWRPSSVRSVLGRPS